MNNDFSKIQALPEEDGDLIKATVTISSVSHCLRELIENSLDAGSKIISIKINNCGLESIVVSDDGCGISKSDLNLICFEGATSKDIKYLSYNDKDEIFTANSNSTIDQSSTQPLNSDTNFLDEITPSPYFKKSKVKCFSSYSGGRGRALGAIASISYLTIESSCNNSGSGFRLTFTESGDRLIQPVSRLKGTSVSVQSLFYGYPVRRHHLLQKKSDEFREIEEVITAFSISTKVTINVTIDGKTITQVHSNNFVRRIKSVLGFEVSSHLIHGKVDLNDWFHDTFLEFYTTPLDGNVNGRIYLSINGRPTINMNIIRAIRSEYRNCNGNKWPVVCLMLTTSARESYEFSPESPFVCIDFVKEEILRSIICTSLNKAWNNEYDSIFSFSFPSVCSFHLLCEKVGENDFNCSQDHSLMNASKKIKFKSNLSSFCLVKNVVRSSLTTEKIIQRFRNAKKDGFNEGFGNRNTIINQSSFAQMEIIGQWNKAFIITRLGADIFAIDQHAACKALNFERIKNKMNEKSQLIKNKQNLLKPVILNVPQEDIENAKLYVKKCQNLGFEYEIIEVENKFEIHSKKFGILVKAIPANKSIATGLHDLQELLALLRDVPQYGEKKFMNSKSRISIKNDRQTSARVGETLSIQMMKKILNDMAESESPWNCPHGNPTWCCIEELQSG